MQNNIESGDYMIACQVEMTKREYVASYFNQEFKVSAKSGKRAVGKLTDKLSAYFTPENKFVFNRISLKKVLENGELSSGKTYYLFDGSWVDCDHPAITTDYDFGDEDRLYWICRQSGITDSEMKAINEEEPLLTQSQKYLVLIDKHIESVDLYELLVNVNLSKIFVGSDRRFWVRKLAANPNDQVVGFKIGFCDDHGNLEKGIKINSGYGLLDMICDDRIRMKFLKSELKQMKKIERKRNKALKQYFDLCKWSAGFEK